MQVSARGDGVVPALAYFLEVPPLVLGALQVPGAGYTRSIHPSIKTEYVDKHTLLGRRMMGVLPISRTEQTLTPGPMLSDCGFEGATKKKDGGARRARTHESVQAGADGTPVLWK